MVRRCTVGPMTSPVPHPRPVLGRTLVAMVTPMSSEGAVSGPDVDALVDHLLAGGCDGIVVAGTTGEAPTLSLDEMGDLVHRVTTRAKGAARVIAGVGTNDTATSVRGALVAAEAGADGLLVVTPYYSRPQQAGIIAHCRAVADSTDLPVMLYDVPARTGTALTPDTLTRLAEHPRIIAVKDAKGDLFEAMEVMAECSLEYYCGIDELNLPYLAAGAIGVVSVTANVWPDRVAALVNAMSAQDLEDARTVNRGLSPMTRALMRPGPAACTAKASLADAGIIADPSVRLPLVAAGTSSVRVGATSSMSRRASTLVRAT